MRIELRKRINGDLMIKDLNLIYVLFHILNNILLYRSTDVTDVTDQQLLTP
jgi:hypothetical protein